MPRKRLPRRNKLLPPNSLSKNQGPSTRARAFHFSFAINSRSVKRLYIGGRIAPLEEAAATARVRAHAVCFLNNYNEGNYLARRQAECDESLLHIAARKMIVREVDGKGRESEGDERRRRLRVAEGQEAEGRRRKLRGGKRRRQRVADRPPTLPLFSPLSSCVSESTVSVSTALSEALTNYFLIRSFEPGLVRGPRV